MGEGAKPHKERRSRRGGVVLLSGSSPRWEKLTIGYHNYPLKGINFWYMYCSKNHFLNKFKYINMKIKKWYSYLFVLIFIIFGFKVRYMYRKIVAFFREVIN